MEGGVSEYLMKYFKENKSEMFRMQLNRSKWNLEKNEGKTTNEHEHNNLLGKILAYISNIF